MIKIDKAKCIGCMKCAKDCLAKDIKLFEGKAMIKNENCVKCGHCIAICPMNAVSSYDYDMSEVKEYNKEEFQLDGDNLLNSIKFNRTIRKFKNKDVEEKVIKKIIEAGRFTQTGGNAQDVSYIVIKDKLQAVREITLLGLRESALKILETKEGREGNFRKYADVWLKMYEAYKLDKDGEDRLFFHAPVVIAIEATSETNGVLAAGNMKLLAEALGVGTMFCGSLVRVLKENKKLKELLGVESGKEVVAAIVLGYPDVKYLRTVPRKEAKIQWK